MKKKKLNLLNLNKKRISSLGSTKGGMPPPPPPTLEHTCQGPVGHAVCATLTCDFICHVRTGDSHIFCVSEFVCNR